MAQKVAPASCGNSTCMALLCQCTEETPQSSSTRFVHSGTTHGNIAEPHSQGFGTLLMEEAERIAREEHGSIKLAVISGERHFARWWVSSLTLPSGVGTRDYYKKLGYELDGPYMSKSLL